MLGGLARVGRRQRAAASTIAEPGELTLGVALGLAVKALVYGILLARACVSLLPAYWILIVPGLGSVWNMFLLKQFMQTLPSSLIDCARIDACSEFGIFWKIILPLAKPGVAVVAIFTFVYQWNSFFWWLLFTNTKD